MATRSPALVLRLFLSLALALLMLVGAEVWLWASGRVEDPDTFQFQRVTQTLRQDAEGRYRLNAARFYELSPDFRHGPRHLGRDATGAWPFRGRPVDPSPPDMLHVAVFGDSCVYGAALDAADMLGSRLADALRDRGWTPDRVAVHSFGVPGYSTVQIDLLLQETLTDWPVDVALFYPAAWNDQAPAVLRPDAELLAAHSRPGPLDWFRQHSRLVAAALHVIERRPFQEILDGWEAGNPPHGYRVPEADVGPNVARMLARCRDAGVPAVVIAPAHPPDTAAKHPRTRRDAAAVLEAARAADVPAVDAQALFDATGLAPGRYFSDYVHPSPEGTAAMAGAAVDAIAARLDERAAARGLSPRGARRTDALRVTAVGPQHASVLGDVALTVRLDGWSPAEPLPAVIVGGAPLIGLRAVAQDMVEGQLMANASGREDVVVQTGRACTWSPGALTRVAPQLAVDAGPPAQLALASRPGDRARVFVAAGLRAVPSWSMRGAYQLDESARPLPLDLAAGAEGLGVVELPPGPGGTYYVQALVSPAGEPAEGGLASRWTPVFAVDLGSPDAGAAGDAARATAPGSAPAGGAGPGTGR